MNKITSGKLIALLISIYFPPETNGGATLAWNRAMVLHKTGYLVFVLCGFPGYPRGKVNDPKYKGKFFYVERVEPFVLIRLRLLGLGHVGYVRRLVIYLNFVFLTIYYLPKIIGITGNLSLIYALAPILFSSISGFVYSKVTKGLFVYEAPDLWPEELVVTKPHLFQLIMFIGKISAKISYTTPDIIITVSQLAGEYISREYRPKAPVYGIPIGVDPNKFPTLSKEDARELLIRNGLISDDIRNRFIILYAGLISAAQGVENLATAAHELRNEKDVVILIVGEGERKQKIEGQKLEHDLGNLLILPVQPRETIPTFISAADVCVVMLAADPIFDIALPTKFYEYLACHKPIVGVCRGELAQIINSKKIGYTVEAGDSGGLVSIIRQLKNSPNSIQDMENNAVKALQQFSLDSISNKFKDVLLEH